MGKIIYHNFYCTNCGAAISLPRNKGYQHKRHHFKKLACYSCGKIVNFYEAKDYEDELYFKENYENGEFAEIANESLSNELLISSF